MLCPPTPELDYLKDVIQYGRDEISLSKIIEAIVQKNQTLKVFKLKDGSQNVSSMDSMDEVMFSKGKFRNKSNNKKNSDGTSNDKHINNAKSIFKCTCCNKMGHTVNFCYKRKREEKEKLENSKDKQTSLLFESGVNYNHELLVASAVFGVDNSWILDSDKTVHATPHKNLFCKLDLCFGGEVKLGNNTSLKIRGIDCVPLKMHDGMIRIVRNVCWLPDLRRNILSESVLDDLGCHVHTFNGIKEVLLTGTFVIKCVKKGGLYIVVSGPIVDNKTLNESECNFMATLTPSFETFGTLKGVTSFSSPGNNFVKEDCGENQLSLADFEVSGEQVESSPNSGTIHQREQ